MVDVEKCKGCGLCVVACPSKVIELAREVNGKGYNYAYMANPEACTGCANCALVCPDTVFQVYREIVHRGDRHARATGGAGAPVAAGQEISHEGALERE